MHRSQTTALTLEQFVDAYGKNAGHAKWSKGAVAEQRLDARVSHRTAAVLVTRPGRPPHREPRSPACPPPLPSTRRASTGAGALAQTHRWSVHDEFVATYGVHAEIYWGVAGRLGAVHVAAAAKLKLQQDQAKTLAEEQAALVSSSHHGTRNPTRASAHARCSWAPIETKRDQLDVWRRTLSRCQEEDATCGNSEAVDTCGLHAVDRTINADRN